MPSRSAGKKYLKNGTIRPLSASKLKKAGCLQSGAVPYIWVDGELRIMLVTASGGGPWMIPKGNIEKDMTPWDSAAKEAFEEAGVIGVCRENVVGEYEYKKNLGVPMRVRIYPMKIEKILSDSEWDESDRRSRRLFRLDKARIIIKEKGIRELLTNPGTEFWENGN